MSLRINFDQALDIWRGASLDAVRSGRPDLTMRQMAVVLTVFLEPPPHTVRGLAAALNIAKPAVVRALDRLEELDFVRRREDPADKRNVLIERTVKGSVYMRETGDLIAAAALVSKR
jgi:DNA-binding MarR family transcriptional regulator